MRLRNLFHRQNLFVQHSFPTLQLRFFLKRLLFALIEKKHRQNTVDFINLRDLKKTMLSRTHLRGAFQLIASM